MNVAPTHTSLPNASALTTPLWTAADLRDATGGTLKAPVTANGVCIDTRSLQPGDLFIALEAQTDGHRFLRQALEKGASCVMAHDLTRPQIDADGQESEPLTEEERARVLLVPDTMKGLEALGRFARARANAVVIAVTGSVGKTTTKEMLRQCLASYGKTHASVASFNNHWGVPLTLARLPRDARFCISEVGMNHPGEIAPLAAQIQPDIAVITTIGSAHLGHMGSLEAIAREKAALFEALPSTGTAIAPDDALYAETAGTAGNDILENALPAGARLWRAGLSPEAALRLEELVCTAHGSSAQLHFPDGQTAKLRLSAPGRHLARNAALVMGVVYATGLKATKPGATILDLTPALKALETFSPEAGRGRTRELSDGVTLLDESYNASGPSLKAALETLALLPARRRVVALGDIRELGVFADSEHRALAEVVVESGAIAFCCGPHMKVLFDALPETLKGAWAPDAATLAPLLKKALKPGDVLLVKGSFSSRMRDVIAFLDDSFS